MVGTVVAKVISSTLSTRGEQGRASNSTLAIQQRRDLSLRGRRVRLRATNQLHRRILRVGRRASLDPGSRHGGWLSPAGATRQHSWTPFPGYHVSVARRG